RRIGGRGGGGGNGAVECFAAPHTVLNQGIPNPSSPNHANPLNRVNPRIGESGAIAGGSKRRWRRCSGGGPLSKDAVSRLVARLRGAFETWRTRSLAEEDIRYVSMDGWYPRSESAGVGSAYRCW